MKLRFLFVFVILLWAKFVFADQDKLIFALDMIRHGDRTPGVALPTISYTWVEGLAQLTAEGMQQEFELGSKLRKKYVEKYKLLPIQYQVDTIEVHSTDSNRTLMSAQSFLMGLYPPGTGPLLSENVAALPYAFQPIPIHTTPRFKETVNTIIPTNEYIDQFRDPLIQSYVHSLPEWQLKENQLKPKFKHWSKITGIKIEILDDLEALGDTLFVHKVHHVPFPSGLAEEDIEEIIKTGDWIYTTEFKVKKIAQLSGQKLLENINKFIKTAVLEQNSQNSQNSLKYVLLSGHDSTISSVMTMLGIPLNEVPPYASNLNFSVFENNSGQYFITLSYNDVLQLIPVCGSIHCPLDRFQLIKF